MADTSTVVDHSTPIHKKVKPRVGSVFGKKGHTGTQNQEDEAESPWQGKRPPPVLSYDSEPESEDESADLSSSSGSFLAWRQRVAKNGRDDSGWSPFTVPLGALLILLAAGSFVAKSMLVHSLWPEPHASQSASVIDDSIYPPETEADLRAACSPLEYETRGVKDNACASLTRCSVGQTVVVHSTATTDRLCGQRQVEPCTPLEYRVPKGSCKALTRCTGENWTANFVELARHVAAVRESISRVQGESAQSTSPIQMLTTQRGLCLTSTVVYCVIITCILARKKKGAEQCASSPELIVTTSTQRLKSATIRNDIMVPELEMSPDRPAPRCGRLSLFANQLLDGGVEDESCTLTGLPDMSGLPHAERTRRRQSAKKESRRLVNAIKAGERFYYEAGKPENGEAGIGPETLDAQDKVMIIVRTGNVHHGGTDQGVYVSVHDGETMSKEHKLVKPVSSQKNTFEKDQYDVFIEDFPQCEHIQTLSVRTDGHRGKTHMMHPEWFLETVTLITSNGSIYHFHCDTWFKRKQKKAFFFERHLLWDAVVRVSESRGTTPHSAVPTLG